MAAESSSKPGLKKAVKASMVKFEGTHLERFQMLKEAGFDGIDMDSYDRKDRDALAQASEKSGLLIHGVVYGQSWRTRFTSPDAAQREAALAGLSAAIEDCKFWGGNTVLVIPGVVDQENYYDEVWDRSLETLKKALPVAEKHEVYISLENVWNNFLVSPVEMAYFIDEFKSPWVKAYFDVGNCMRYGWPEQWARALGQRIIKLDIKEFSTKKMNEEGLYKGFVDLWDGDVNWKAVMDEMRALDYTDGWGTAEIAGGGRERMVEIAEKMDRIYAA